jgi:hypothetical protein
LLRERLRRFAFLDEKQKIGDYGFSWQDVCVLGLDFYFYCAFIERLVFLKLWDLDFIDRRKKFRKEALLFFLSLSCPGSLNKR